MSRAQVERVRPRVFWYEQRASPARSSTPLSADATTDVVIVGGGMAGLSCAESCIENGHKVVLLEQAFCGAGASGRSSGFITPDAELELGDLVRNRGRQAARRLWEFVSGGVEAIRANIERHRIDCDMQLQDSLFIASSSKGASVVREEHRARTSLGYASTLYEREQLPSVVGSDAYFGGVRYPGTFGINAYRYCQALRDELQRAGVVIHERSAVTAIEEGRVQANGHWVRAAAIVLCVDRSLPALDVLPTKVYHAQTFLAVSAPLKPLQIAALFPAQRLMVWDTDLIYQYFRLIGDDRLLLGAASLRYTYEKQERASAPRVLAKMRRWCASKFPQLPLEIEYFWPGLIGVSKDFLPLAARASDRSKLYLVSGAAGLPWAAALGRYIGEKIHSNRADFDADFDPRRHFPVGDTAQSLIGKPGAFALSHVIVKYLR